MANEATIGALTAADITTALDPIASLLFNSWATLGIGAPAETATLAYFSRLARTKAEGDGTTANPGIANATYKQRILPHLNTIALQNRYDIHFQLQLRQFFNDTDAFILSNLPKRTNTDAWKFSGANGERALDLHLLRMNGNPGSALAPAAPTWTPTLNATTGGQVAPTTAGTEPRVKVGYVGAKDYYESLPSAASAQVALAGKNNAWYLTDPGGNVPTGVYKLRVYRQLDANAGAGDPFPWDQDLVVVAGQPWSNFLGVNGLKLKNSDQQLRRDWTPPSWLSAMMMPEHAALYALAVASMSDKPSEQAGLMQYAAAAFMSPGNVAMNPVYKNTDTVALLAFQGANNPYGAAEFARWVATAFTEGAPRLTNDAAQALQGFAGAANGIRARTIATLNGAASFTNFKYWYYDSANPFTIQSQTVTPGGTLGTAVGSTLTMGVTAGRLVTRVESVTIGTATTGSLIFEAIPHRSL